VTQDLILRGIPRVGQEYSQLTLFMLLVILGWLP
jgi:hypothetical protein